MTVDGSGRTKHLPSATPQEPGPDEPFMPGDPPVDAPPKGDDGGNGGDDVTTNPDTGAQG
jgi:hypothetical protein